MTLPLRQRTLRHGVDVVRISRMAEALTRATTLEERLFTVGERAYARSRPRPEQHLAARFAAKEAAFKALGAGWPTVGWHDVEVVSTGGEPVLRLKGRALAMAGDVLATVSLSHDGDVALAQVLLQASPAEEGGGG